MRHTWLLNHGAPIPRLATLLAMPTAWESTGLVVGFGTDVFISRVAPARRFDQLDPEFNAGLFITLLAAAAIGTVILGRFATQRDLSEAWR